MRGLRTGKKKAEKEHAEESPLKPPKNKLDSPGMRQEAVRTPRALNLRERWRQQNTNLSTAKTVPELILAFNKLRYENIFPGPNQSPKLRLENQHERKIASRKAVPVPVARVVCSQISIFGIEFF